MFFTMAFPLLLLLFVGAVYGNEVNDGVKYIDEFVPTVVAIVAANLGVMGVSLNLADLRARGVLRRYKLVPLPLWCFFAAQIAVGVVMFVVSLSALFAVTALGYGLRVHGSLAACAAVSGLTLATTITIGFLLAASEPASAPSSWRGRRSSSSCSSAPGRPSPGPSSPVGSAPSPRSTRSPRSWRRSSTRSSGVLWVRTCRPWPPSRPSSSSARWPLAACSVGRHPYDPSRAVAEPHRSPSQGPAHGRRVRSHPRGDGALQPLWRARAFTTYFRPGGGLPITSATASTSTSTTCCGSCSDSRVSTPASVAPCMAGARGSTCSG